MALTLLLYFSGFVGASSYVSCGNGSAASRADLFYNLLAFVVLSLRHRSCFDGMFVSGFASQVLLIYVYMQHRSYESVLLALSFLVSLLFQ